MANTKETKENSKSLIREALSENGIGSAKRVLGMIIVLICMGCIVYFSITEGCTDNVKSLIETALIVASALLGLYSITSIWKNNGGNSQNKQ